MLDASELLFTVDENNTPITPQKRKKVHTNNIWHRTSGIWVYNTKKQILCQKRSLKKDMKPGYWEAFFGGHLKTGEEYDDNAALELTEELGIPILTKQLNFYKIMKSTKITHKEFQAIYLYKTERDDTLFPFEKDEIDTIAWFSWEKLYTILLNDQDNNWVRKPWDKEILTLITNKLP